jgi:hypothetical protein
VILKQSFDILFSAPEFLAYIDPNAGGLLMQYLVPVFVAIGAGWVFLKDRVSDALTRVFRRSRSDSRFQG